MTGRPPSQTARQPLTSKYLVLALVTFGLVLFALDFDAAKLPRYCVAIATCGLVFFPPFRRRLPEWIDLLNGSTRRTRCATAAIVFLVSAVYFLTTALLANRDLFPKFHDEHMYLLQARMLATGHLWLPPHPLAAFFDSFNVIVSPVYAATYFPGTALFYVPGIWLHLPPYFTSVAITAAAVAMLYLVMAELFDGIAGLLSALIALSLTQLRVLAVMTMSHPALLLLLLMATWTYFRWRQSRRIAWAVAFGAATGWSAITRPLDAACLLLPFIVLFMRESIRPQYLPARRHFAAALPTLFVVLCAATPFLALQSVFDQHVTGSVLRTPFGDYTRANFPSLQFGFSSPANPSGESYSPLPQVRDYYRLFLRPDLVQHAQTPFLRTWIAQRLKPAADVTLPAHLLLIFIPAGLLAFRRHVERAALAAGAASLPIAYALYPSYLQHYGLACIPAFTTLVLGGQTLVRKSLPRAIAPVFPISIAALCLVSLPELRGTHDPFMQAPYLADINAKLAHLDHVPAVVLFHYDSGRTDIHEEPVYNLDTPNPDDAPVIRCQDLGPAKNRLIYKYYAERQPRRFFYLYNRTSAELSPLGYASELASPRKIGQ